jgi:hypothetical protein
MSKVFKGVAKVVKKVAKPLKKIAPIALAIAAPYALGAMAPAMFGASALGGFGPALAAGVGSFGGTLIGGGSIGDALKSGLMAGALSGVGGVLSGKMGPAALAAKRATGVAHMPGVGAGAAKAAAMPLSQVSSSPFGAYQGTDFMKGIQAANVIKPAVQTGTGGNILKTLTAGKYNPLKILSSAKGFIEDKPKTSAALALGAGALLGSAGQKQQAVPDVDMEGMRTGKSARDIMKENPFKHWIQNLRWTTPAGQTQGVKYAGGIPQFGQNLLGVKEGGIIQAKEGGLLNGPGTGTSDSIKGHIEGDGGIKQPVRLSDGEFVIKANAVKNLGGGSTREGAKKLYALQRQWDNMATA